MATIASADSKIGQQIARITNAKKALADYLKDNTDLVTENMSINELVEAILALIGQKGAYNIVQNLLDDGNSELVITDASGSNANELDSLITREISGAYTNDRVTQKIDFLSVNNIESSAFIYARQLDTLILRNSNVCVLKNIDAFDSTKIAAGIGYIYVPDNLVDSYKIATNWVTFANQIKPISELEGS